MNTFQPVPNDAQFCCDSARDLASIYDQREARTVDCGCPNGAGKHQLDRDANPQGISVLAIARDLSMDHVDRDYTELRTHLIALRQNDGLDTTFEWAQELNLREWIHTQRTMFAAA